MTALALATESAKQSLFELEKNLDCDFSVRNYVVGIDLAEDKSAPCNLVLVGAPVRR
jgi:hypothetical protein